MADGVTAGTVTFSGTGYTLNSATDGATLTVNTGVVATVGATINTNLNNATGAFSVAGGQTLLVNGGISGSNGLTKSDAGILSLGGTNTYAGTTTINAGTLSLASPTYRYYQFTPTMNNGGGTGAYQMSEFHYLNGATAVDTGTNPANPATTHNGITVTNPGGTNAVNAGEAP